MSIFPNILLFFITSVLLSGSLTGTILGLCTNLYEHLPAKKYVSMQNYNLLNRLVIGTFLLPVFALPVKLIQIFSGSLIDLAQWDWLVGKFYVIGCWLFWVWIAGIVFFTILNLYRYWCFRKKYLTAKSKDISQETAAVRNYAATLLHTRRDRSALVYYSPAAVTPFTYGTVFPKIVLPDRRFSLHQLLVIQIHELNHIRCHDVLFKKLLVFLRIIYWFNPYIYYLSKHNDYTSECCCDERSCQVGKEYFNPEQYFETICQISNSANINYVAVSALFEEKSLLERRIMNMRSYALSSKMLRVITCLSMLVFFIFSTSTVNAASNVIAQAYGQWLDENMVVQEIAFIPVPVREDWTTHVLTENETAIGKPLVDTEDFMLNRSSGFNEKLAPGQKKSVPYAQVSKGGTIDGFVSALPSDVDIEIGIQKSGQSTTQSMNFKQQCSFSFPVESSGDYSFYIKNISDQEITVLGEVNYN